MKFWRAICCSIITVLPLLTSPAQAEQERSLGDVKKEVMRRAGRSNPFDGVRPADAEQVLKSITSLNRDEWAKAWCDIGVAYEAKGDELAKEGASPKEVGELYNLAFNNCMVGRYPVASTAGKKDAYRHSVRIFRKAAVYFEVPLQIVEIPFEGKKLVGYLQIPAGTVKPPVVINWAA